MLQEEVEDVNRQRRVLTAQARLSALIVGGLPLIWLPFGGWSRLHGLVESGSGGAMVATVGIVMEIIGMAFVWRMAVAP